MTVLTTVRPYYRLSDVLREDVDAALAGFRTYLAQRVRPKVAVPKSDTVSLLPASPVTESEPEVDFLPETQTQRRTHKPREDAKEIDIARLYDRTLKDRIVAFVAERGPVTSGDIGQHFGMHRRRTSVLLSDLKNHKRLFVVGHKKNGHNQTVKVLHTDPNYPYVSPDLAPAEPVVEEKRPARIPSLAAVDRGRALVARNFRSDSIAMRVLEQICIRPRSSPELEKLFRSSNSRMKFMLDRMRDLGIVEQIGQERNEVAGRIRAVWGVVESSASTETMTQRVPPSAETVEKGRKLILSRCLRGGGKTLLAFQELCAAGPLTRGDLQKRIGCDNTMIDTAVRNLDSFGLVVDIGKVMDPKTGKMCRLWDVKSETEVQP